MSDAAPIAPFVGDPDKVELMANRGDVAQLVASLALAITAQMEATAIAATGKEPATLEALENVRGHMAVLAEEFREFVGRSAERSHDG